MPEAKRDSIIIPVSLAENLRGSLTECLDREKAALNDSRIENPLFMRSIINRVISCLGNTNLSSGNHQTVLKLRAGEAQFFAEAFDKLQGLNGRRLIEKLVKYLNKSINTVCRTAMEESGNRLSGDAFEKMFLRLLKDQNHEKIRGEDAFGRRTEVWFRTEGLNILKTHMSPDEAEAFLELLVSSRGPKDKKFGAISCYTLMEALKRFKDMKRSQAGLEDLA